MRPLQLDSLKMGRFGCGRQFDQIVALARLHRHLFDRAQLLERAALLALPARRHGLRLLVPELAELVQRQYLAVVVDAPGRAHDRVRQGLAGGVEHGQITEIGARQVEQDPRRQHDPLQRFVVIGDLCLVGEIVDCRLRRECAEEQAGGQCERFTHGSTPGCRNRRRRRAAESARSNRSRPAGHRRRGTTRCVRPCRWRRGRRTTS